MFFSQVPSTSRRAGRGSWPQSGSLQVLSVWDGPKTYTQAAKKDKQTTRVGEPLCHPFSLSKTRLGEQKYVLALWDFSAHVLTGLSRPSSLKSSCKPKDTEASVAGMVFFKEKDSKVFMN